MERGEGLTNHRSNTYGQAKEDYMRSYAIENVEIVCLE